MDQLSLFKAPTYEISILIGVRTKKSKKKLEINLTTFTQIEPEWRKTSSDLDEVIQYFKSIFDPKTPLILYRMDPYIHPKYGGGRFIRVEVWRNQIANEMIESGEMIENWSILKTIKQTRKE